MAEWMNEITCSEFTTHSAPSGWELHFRTPNQEDFIAVQDLCRKLIGHGKPTTNADRIRAMSDEELAKKLAWRAECPDKAHQDKCNEDCFGCWLDWLRQEVET